MASAAQPTRIQTYLKAHPRAPIVLGVGIAIAAARTQAAPLVVVILAAAVVYQLLTF
ncbi:MAG TPA: hypothetical protein VMV41_00140 [Cellulomonadaceae bacterium]|nr:hypothetical protein [Cellulomonadaceae bacterium]